MADSKHKTVGRRQFMRAAGAATAALSIVPARTVRGSEANSKIKLGLIGCGGRGKWIARLFKEQPFEIVALHDYFRDRVTQAGERIGVDPAHHHVGLDGYKALLEEDIDAVAIESPPYCHPEQVAAAVDAGKHVYLAKPIAVDVPGCQTIVESAERVQDKLSVFVDFQTRNNEFFRGAAQRVHEGMIGAPVCGQFAYHTGRLRPQAKPGSELARLRNWVFDIALSGCIIVEQNIHVLDVANWYLNGHPVKAVGSGGRKARVDVGDAWDHYVVRYDYPNDVLVDFASTQFLYGFDDMCMRLFGSEGTVDSHYGGNVNIRGKSQSWKGGDTRAIYQEGALNNIKDFHASIVEGKPINNTQESANSTLTSILGRMAAHRGQPVTWDEMMAEAEVLDPKLDLPADGPESSV